MNRPNPSHARAALFCAACLVLAAFCPAASAQSGRKAQKPLGLPTEQPKPADPAGGKTAETKRVEALATFVVMRDDTLSMGFDTLAQDGVAGAFVERLRQVGGAVEIKDGGRGRRTQARDRAKKEETAYTVFFQMEESGYGGANTDMRSVVLRTYVYTPKTADLKYSDTVFQRPYYDSARVGGVRVPVPTRRVERYPSQNQLEQAARDAADRLLSRFQITPPPEQ
jgi:hypothetical protein